MCCCRGAKKGGAVRQCRMKREAGSYKGSNCFSPTRRMLSCRSLPPLSVPLALTYKCILLLCSSSCLGGHAGYILSAHAPPTPPSKPHTDTIRLPPPHLCRSSCSWVWAAGCNVWNALALCPPLPSPRPPDRPSFSWVWAVVSRPAAMCGAHCATSRGTVPCTRPGGTSAERASPVSER